MSKSPYMHLGIGVDLEQVRDEGAVIRGVADRHAGTYLTIRTQTGTQQVLLTLTPWQAETLLELANPKGSG